VALKQKNSSFRVADLAIEISIDSGPKHPGGNIIIRYSAQVAGGWYPLHSELSNLGVWRHACISVDIPSDKLFFANGNFSTNVTIPGIQNSTLNLLSQWDQSHLWSMVETVSEINVFTTNMDKVRCGDKGDLISWASPFWSFDQRFPSLARKKTDDKRKVCGEDDPPAVIVTLPVQPDFWGAVNLCRLLGNGEVTAYYSFPDWAEALAKAKEDIGPITYMWFPFLRVNGTYIDFYSKKPVNNIIWRPGSPDWLQTFDCVFCHDNGCSARDCLTKLAAHFQCSFKRRPILFLKGLCSNSNLDREYYPANRMGQFLWIGLSGSYIKYNQSTNIWVVKAQNVNTWAAVEARYDSLMLGTNVWTIHNDYNCFSSSMVKMRINLSFCSNSMFSCHDGNCTKIENRCNKKIDCPDGSDEKECEVVLLPEYYDKVTGGHCCVKL
jgi:Low-density lipoprotein receptor domain class A